MPILRDELPLIESPPWDSPTVVIRGKLGEKALISPPESPKWTIKVDISRHNLTKLLGLRASRFLKVARPRAQHFQGPGTRGWPYRIQSGRRSSAKFYIIDQSVIFALYESSRLTLAFHWSSS